MEERIEDIEIKVDGMGLYSPMEIRDMIQASVESENRDNPNAHIRLLGIDELDHYLANHQEEGRQQLIIYNGNHFTAADILVEDGIKSCIVLDAANDSRFLAVEDCFNQAGYATYTACSFSFSDKNLQTDVFSCPLFALDHCAQFAKTSDAIHSVVKDKSDEINSFTWDVLPPNFLWNIQSVQTKNEYAKRYPTEAAKPMHNQISFNAYTDLGLVRDSKGKEYNHSIIVHVFETVEATYITQQRDQALAKMDGKIEEVMAKEKQEPQQIEALYTIREELAHSADLSQFKALMQSFDAAATPPKTTRLRSIMNYMRGSQPVAPAIQNEAKKDVPDKHSTASTSKIPGKF